MARYGGLAAIISLGLVASGPPAAGQPGDPLAYLRPTVEISAADRQQIGAGRPLTLVLPAQAREISVLVATRVNADGDRLVRWIRRIVDLKNSSYVLAIGRFSHPPRLDDLAGLTLDKGDVAELETCRPNDCGLKLSPIEIDELQRTPRRGRDFDDAQVQRAFRQIVLRRAEAYLRGGPSVVSGQVDSNRRPVTLDAAFASLVGHTEFITRHVPGFADYLRRPPVTPMPGVESFMYWSKEQLAGKPSISVVHVSIARGGPGDGMPDVLAAGKLIFATHYVNASVAYTALLRGAPGSANYLVYLNRSNLDLLDGRLGGLTRWVIQRRVRSEAGDLVRGLQRRLESGDPP